MTAQFLYWPIIGNPGLVKNPHCAFQRQQPPLSEALAYSDDMASLSEAAASRSLGQNQPPLSMGEGLANGTTL